MRLPMQPAPRSYFRSPLDSILGTVATVRVLRALVTSNAAVTQSDLLRDTRLARGSVRTAVDSLRAAGVLTTLGAPRGLLYRLKPEHYLSATIQAMFDAERARTTRVYDAIRALAEPHDPAILGVWLYGSVARGDDTVQSDFDLAVVVDAERAEPATATLRDALYEVTQQNGVSVSMTAFSPAELHDLPALNPAFWENLEHDAMVLYGSTPDAVAARIRRRAAVPTTGHTHD